MQSVFLGLDYALDEIWDSEHLCIVITQKSVHTFRRKQLLLMCTKAIIELW